MDRTEIRNWYKLLIKEDKSNKENIIEFINEHFGTDDGELMRQIINEENLIVIDNMNRKLAELENEIDSDEVFNSTTKIDDFSYLDEKENEIWK